MPTKTITITVPASSLADRVLLSLRESTGLRKPLLTAQHVAEDITEGRAVECEWDVRRVRVALSWLRRRGFVEGHVFGPNRHERTVAWRIVERVGCSFSVATGRVQWTAEVDA